MFYTEIKIEQWKYKNNKMVNSLDITLYMTLIIVFYELLIINNLFYYDLLIIQYMGIRFQQIFQLSPRVCQGNLASIKCPIKPTKYTFICAFERRIC